MSEDIWNLVDALRVEDVLAPWRQKAACRGEPTSLFFSANSADYQRAHAICAKCPVRSECDDFANRTGQHGVWAGRARRLRVKGFTHVLLTCAICGDEFTWKRARNRRPTICKKARCKRERNRRENLRYNERRGKDPTWWAVRGHGQDEKVKSGCRCKVCKAARREKRAAVRAKQVA